MDVLTLSLKYRSMIYDFLANSSLYSSAHARLAKGFEWLKKMDIKTEDSKIEIQGEDVFAIVQSYNTYPKEERRFESHRTYLDIQYVFEGEEIMYYAPTSELQVSEAYDTERDVAFYVDPQSNVAIPVKAGQFTIFYPEDAHKPCCMTSASKFVRKVVVKVKL